MELSELKSKIRDIKDFPTEGVLFRDITTLLRGWRRLPRARGRFRPASLRRTARPREEFALAPRFGPF